MTPFELEVGDIVVVSSDGLQYLEDAKIQKILHKYRRKKAAEIAGHLLEAIEALADPDQDNCTFSVIKLNHNKPVVNAIRAKPAGEVDTQGSKITRVVEVDEIEDVAATVEKKIVRKQDQPVIKEVKPLKPLDSGSDAASDKDEVDAADPPAKIAAGGK